MFANNSTWYSIELTKENAGILKDYLRKTHVYFEPSEAGYLVHFECRMTREEYDLVNEFLAKTIAKGANTSA